MDKFRPKTQGTEVGAADQKKTTGPRTMSPNRRPVMARMRQPMGQLKDIRDVNAVYNQMNAQKSQKFDVRDIMRVKSGNRTSSKPDWTQIHTSAQTILIDDKRSDGTYASTN